MSISYNPLQVQNNNALVFLFALCKGCVRSMLLCSRINVETTKGSVTQMEGRGGRLLTITTPRHMPPHAELQGRKKRAEPYLRVWLQSTSSFFRGELRMCFTQHKLHKLREGCSVSHPSVLIQGSIRQSPLNVLPLSSGLDFLLQVMNPRGSSPTLFHMNTA